MELVRDNVQWRAAFVVLNLRVPLPEFVSECAFVPGLWQ
jgi:hypothetical protein